jgi:hypothetical protein
VPGTAPGIDLERGGLLLVEGTARHKQRTRTAKFRNSFDDDILDGRSKLDFFEDSTIDRGAVLGTGHRFEQGPRSVSEGNPETVSAN